VRSISLVEIGCRDLFAHAIQQGEVTARAVRTDNFVPALELLAVMSRVINLTIHDVLAEMKEKRDKRVDWPGTVAAIGNCTVGPGR